MSRPRKQAVGWLVACSLMAVPTLGDESGDVTFSTQYASGRPTTANFYFNGRAVGTGRTAFATIVDRVGKLPPGTSVVWGPNYQRCGSCSGDEPACVPKFLYPDLWARLETFVRDRRLTLSSEYPGPWPTPVGSEGRQPMPTPVSETDNAAKQPFDAVLDWEIDHTLTNRYELRGELPIKESRWYRFSSGGKVLHRFTFDLFFGRIPENGRVLIRASLTGRGDSRSAGARQLAEGVRAVWQDEVGDELRRGRLKATVVAPPRLIEALRLPARPDNLVVSWGNYRGPQTPHEEVLYLADGRFLGRGDEGFARLLTEVGKLPAGAEVLLPRYEYGTRADFENLGREGVDARNAKLGDLVPFRGGRRELQTAVNKRGLTLRRSEIHPDADSRTVLDWESGDRYGRAFVSFGRIVRHDERWPPTPLRLAWTGYESAESGAERAIESQAIYTVNGKETGRGVSGFAKAVEKLQALPEGSVVQVWVCLRTKGPFKCPITYEGRRHFERTGFEPYFGMFPWIIDVARRHRLEVQWIPDEGESCADCQLNR